MEACECCFLNKNGKQSQKEAQRLLNDRIESKLNDKTPTNLKTCDEWLNRSIKTSGFKLSTIKTKEYIVKHIKRNIK